MKIKQKEDRKIRLKKGDKTEEQNRKSEECKSKSKKKNRKKKIKGPAEVFSIYSPSL